MGAKMGYVRYVLQVHRHCTRLDRHLTLMQALAVRHSITGMMGLATSSKRPLSGEKWGRVWARAAYCKGDDIESELRQAQLSCLCFNSSCGRFDFFRTQGIKGMAAYGHGHLRLAKPANGVLVTPSVTHRYYMALILALLLF